MAYELNTLVDMFNSYLISELTSSPNTVEAYYHDVQRFVQFLEMKEILTADNITKGQVAGYIRYLSRLGLSSSSIARNISALRTFWSFLVVNQYVENDPLEGVELPKMAKQIPDVLSVEEVEKIISAI
ncbi:site-specific tyrosine recombinase XerD, partial [bacterium]